MAFQKQKRLKRFIEADQQGEVLDSERQGIENYQQRKRAFEVAEAKNTAKRVVEHNRKQAILSARRSGPEVLRQLRGNFAFVQAQTAVSRADLAKLGIKLSPGRLRAANFIVDDVTRPGQRNLWQLVLGGGLAITPDFGASQGARGQLLVYKAAVWGARSL